MSHSGILVCQLCDHCTKGKLATAIKDPNIPIPYFAVALQPLIVQLSTILLRFVLLGSTMASVEKHEAQVWVRPSW